MKNTIETFSALGARLLGFGDDDALVSVHEQHMEQIMSRYWINFTKTGNPNGNSLPFWTTYQEGKPTVMIMKEGLHLGPVQNQKQMDFFEKFFKEKRK